MVLSFLLLHHESAPDECTISVCDCHTNLSLTSGTYEVKVREEKRRSGYLNVINGTTYAKTNRGILWED